jgi:hypothetical protein
MVLFRLLLGLHPNVDLQTFFILNGLWSLGFTLVFRRNGGTVRIARRCVGRIGQLISQITIGEMFQDFGFAVNPSWVVAGFGY